MTRERERGDTDGGTPPPKYGRDEASQQRPLESLPLPIYADGRNFNDVITSARYAPAMILLAYNLEQGVGCGDQVQRAACFCFCICTSLYLLLLLLYMHKSLFVRARARGVLHFTTKAL